MPTLVTMPKWGLTMQSGTITGWIASEGEEVSAGAPLLTVETEKAVNDVEAPADGVLMKILADTGAEVPVSGPVAVLAALGETISDDDLAALLAGAATVGASAVGASAAVAAGPAERRARPAGRDGAGRVLASPAARKLASELGIDLAAVDATGPGGRVTSEDVERAAAAAATMPREERVVTESGPTLQALVAGPAEAAANIVFLHGLGGSISTWTQVLGEFVPEARVAALDLPGHGRSDKPDAAETDYSVAAMATTVGDAIVALGMAPAVIVGHSMGAAVALQIALERPKIVRGLVLVNGAGLGKEISATLVDRVEAEPSLDEARQMLELFFENKRLILARGVEEMHQARSAPGADAALKAVAAAAFDREGQKVSFVDRLGDITVPTLIVWGEFDRVIPVGHAAAAAKAIPGSWLEVFEGIGHVPQIEAPARFVALVQHWLSRQPPPEPVVESAAEAAAEPTEPAESAATTAEPAESGEDSAEAAAASAKPAGEPPATS
ncbi:MAG: alpha/beta fold hydrolase [Thermomicrobiales bacterium]|nr:alpha/beta fold hydrolase [Thermomicrobiales bacterium]